MMDIDESYGLSGPPFDDEDDTAMTASERYEMDRCDAQDHSDNRREEYRIFNR